MLWIATAGVLAFAFFPNYVGAFGAGRAGDDDAMVAQVALTVDGMTCDGCAVTVKQALLKVPGVVTVLVSYEESRAVVGLDPEAAHSAPDDLIAAVNEAGYSASLRLPAD